MTPGPQFETVASETIHASCVAIDGRAVLIEGSSGAGKSDLALRLIDRGAVLVSDDYTVLDACGGALIATPPANLAGRMEVRGIGIVEVAHVAEVPVALMVTIVAVPARMPERDIVRRIAGIDIRAIALPALESSAPIKVELVLRGVAS